MNDRTEPNYATYLKIDPLLGLQEPLSEPPEHDEMLFIVIHQVYELWFKLVLHELEKIKVDLSGGDLFGACTTIKRVRTVMKTLVGQLDILETMTPMSFSAFRERLQTASGFQSVQFRELEFVLGRKRTEILASFPEGSAGRKRLEKRLREPSLVHHLYDFLESRGVSIPAGLKKRDVTLPTDPDPQVQDGIVRLYRESPEVAMLLELLTDFDEGLQEWRYRHVKLTERTIGGQTGTGGSEGVEYLKRTLFQPVFPDLWAIRHRF